MGSVAVVGSPYEQAPHRADIFAFLCHGESPPLPSAHPDDLTYGVRVLTVIPRSVMEDRIKLELPGHTWPQRAPTPSTAVVPFVRFGPRKRTCASSKSSHREKPRSRRLSSVQVPLFGHFWSESFGQIYPTLGELEWLG